MTFKIVYLILCDVFVVIIVLLFSLLVRLYKCIDYTVGCSMRNHLMPLTSSILFNKLTSAIY